MPTGRIGQLKEVNLISLFPLDNRNAETVMLGFGIVFQNNIL
jgi:hypothetical protein